jgi:hypothetical protein
MKTIALIAALSMTACATSGQYKTAFWEKDCADTRISVGEHGSPVVHQYCAAKDLVYTGDIVRRFGGSDKAELSDVYYYRDGMVWLNPNDASSATLRASLTAAVFPYPSHDKYKASLR